VKSVYLLIYIYYSSIQAFEMKRGRRKIDFFIVTYSKQASESFPQYFICHQSQIRFIKFESDERRFLQNMSRDRCYQSIINAMYVLGQSPICPSTVSPAMAYSKRNEFLRVMYVNIEFNAIHVTYDRIIIMINNFIIYLHFYVPKKCPYTGKFPFIMQSKIKPFNEVRMTFYWVIG